ncbi:MAG TPA: ABC transporter ATP-binding protein [Candidatus Saccharimonadia bacterium]|nr:ABC transporter ATP-binding protein [Candidatus Saccharimonadia bacterium]
MNAIELHGITKIYKTGDEDTAALQGVDLTVKKGEFVAIMGPSGSGKSTLMHIIGLLDRPTAGVYRLDGQDVSTLTKRKQAQIRNREIGFVFQQFNLLPRASVLENVLLPTLYGKIDEPVKQAKRLIEQVGLGDRLNNRSNQLSGGQVQRVAIARALVMSPTIILADEPTGNLDSKRSAEIMDLLGDINKAGATIVLITHEPDVAAYADRIVTIRDGQIVSSKAPTQAKPAKQEAAA